MKIITEAHSIQSDEQHHDVECYAQYENDPRVWKRRVWLDKTSNEMVESDIIEYSKDDSDMFDEVKWEEVPRDIRETLDGRVDAAKDNILAPLMENNMKKIYITIDGGVLTSVVTDDPNMKVILCDEDDFQAMGEKDRAEMEVIHKEIEDGVGNKELFEVL